MLLFIMHSGARDIIGLITSRSEIKDLLQLDDVIDLVIPRGSNALVQHIKSNTKTCSVFFTAPTSG